MSAAVREGATPSRRGKPALLLLSRELVKRGRVLRGPIYVDRPSGRKFPLMGTVQFPNLSVARRGPASFSGWSMRYGASGSRTGRFTENAFT